MSDLPITFLATSQIEDYNYCYFPILFQSESLLLQCKSALEDQNIGSRLYFLPGLNTFDYIDGACPISDQIAERILYVSLYHTLSEVEQKMIVRILLRVQNN